MNRRRSPQKMLTDASNHQFTVERFVTHRDFVESCGISLQINRHFDGVLTSSPHKKKSLPKRHEFSIGIHLLDPTFGFFCGGDCITRCVHWSPRHANQAGRFASWKFGDGSDSLERSPSPQAVSKPFRMCAKLTQTHPQKFVRLAKPSRKLQSSQSLGPDPGSRGAWPCSPVVTWPLNCNFLPENSENWDAANFTIC